MRHALIPARRLRLAAVRLLAVSTFVMPAIFFVANPAFAGDRSSGSNEAAVGQRTSEEEMGGLLNARDAAFEALGQRAFADTESTQALGTRLSGSARCIDALLRTSAGVAAAGVAAHH
jgi:hypothetical protein